VSRLLDHSAELSALREGARAEFEARYTADANRAQLLAIYQRALGARQRVAAGAPASAVS
jgi:glycosyltransferase involved in cell wall biosynthesis